MKNNEGVNNLEKNFSISLIQEISKNDNEKYIEENKFVLFNVIIKIKNEACFTVDKLSIGYMLPDNKVFDLISKNVYIPYKLYEKDNKEKEGVFALVNHHIFKNSDRKIRMSKNNIDEIEIIINNYLYCNPQIKKELKFK